MRRFGKCLFFAASLAAIAAAATPASAQRVTRIVAFGDSYADDGNLFELLGIPRPAVYPTGRFSGGTNFIDTMQQILGVPVDNFAIGGAFTGNGNINGPGIPGFTTEWQSYLAGGGPAAFPRTNGGFGPNDLLVISIGGNDARAYSRSLGLTPTPAQISTLLAGVPGQVQTRVAEATTGLGALVNAGARNITFLAGDVGRLPEVNGLAISQVGSAYSGAFNQGMQASLANFANQGVIVNYLDLNLIGDRVAQNLAAFGLTSAGACPIECVTTNPALLSRYLFYVDQVHLTSRGFEIVGQYAVRQLEAPLHLAAQADVGLQVADAFGATLAGRLDLSNARFGAERQGFAFYVTGNMASVSRPDQLQSLGYELDTTGISAGAEYEAGGAIFGAALNYSRGEADMATASGRAKATGWQAGLYGGWSGGGAFVQGQATYGRLDYDISRTAVIDDITADTDGTALTLGAQAGYLFDLGGMRVGPVLALRYAKVELDGFTETGDPVLTLNVQDQQVSSLLGRAGIEARGDLEVGGLAVRPYAQALLEREFDEDGRTVRYAATAAPGIVNQWVLPGASDELYGRLAGGATLELGGAAAVQIGASTTVSRDGGNETTGFLSLRLGL